MRTVLVIDDNPAVGTALDLLFGLRDIRTLTATTPRQGLDLLARERVDLVVQDMNFSADTTSGEEGVALYRAIRADHPDLPIILLTAWTRLETAVELVKAGAADYLGKPWDDHKLLATVENLLELSEATREVARFRDERRRRRRQLDARYDLRGIVFASGAMERVVELACQVARADVPVLITGPNGAGKERIAEIVQANSSRAKGPFVTVNCGALPSELIEAELFGAEPGAYTGAPNRAREGRFEVADGGTLFLDEIGNLPLAGQMKLLRVLETGQFERLGSSRTRHADVRVVSATNADLAAAIRDGRFREDLYYRLNVIELRLPPLAERSDDVLPLAEHFLQGRATLDASARTALATHAWPGNVRELKNAIERASLLCSDGVVTARDLGLSGARAPGTRLPLDAEPDRASIEAAIQRTRGVISQAAAELGLSRQALYRRMEKMGIGS
ncbi:MAG TPA: sigma-54 dependent transcriptional regulator [Dokdonella sp.]|uniref:sigma-54-dependent transcriptional regulator n=1 Tax=Dokdonella sp. TaxID=2291710 RepID=UPI0025C0024E|nr:sigma-54 dependent transcriptional regulator [Dokdonella sp.]MBX3690697.1 sigma-54-dependent Fis family transcriptional regulator [Dokdonella sp.]HNR92809.1 sigma-54 dependent transcriptional regulator [Dokdonella sp.]